MRKGELNAKDFNFKREIKKQTNKKKEIVHKNSDMNNKNLFPINTIRFRLLGSYVLLVGFIVLVGVLSYLKSSEAIINNYIDSTKQSMNMLGEYLEYGFSTVKSCAVEYLADADLTNYVSARYDNVSRDTYYTNKKQNIITKAEADPFISNIYFVSDNDFSLTTCQASVENMFTTYTNTKQGKQIAENPKSYYWFGKPAVFDDVLKVKTNTYALRLVKCFYVKKAFLAIDIDKEAVLKILNKLNPGEGSFVYFVTADNVALFQDGSRENKFMKTDFYKDAFNSSKITDCNDHVFINGKSYLFIYRKIGDTGAMVCSLIPKSNITKQADKIKLVTLIVVLIACILAVMIGTGIFLSISKAISYIVGKMKLIAKGNITTRINLKHKDEFSQLGSNMNEMLDNISTLLKNVKNVSDNVSLCANDVMESSSVFSKSSKDISDAMNEIESGLVQQAENTLTCENKLDGLATQIGLVDTDTSDIKSIAEKTKLSIQDNLQRMVVLKDKSVETTAITQNVICSLQELHEKSKAIDYITKSINEIADETTLLSLNASIEAARAGDAGRGFAVVANEIKKLAESSIVATQKIRKIVDEINKTALQAVITANSAGEIIKSQKESVNSTKNAFDEMKQQVEELISKVSNIIGSINKMQGDKGETVNEMMSISSVTQQIVASVGTINDKTNNEVETVKNLIGLSEEMLNQVFQLQDAMKKFIIESNE